jgi:signal peptidase II
VAGLGFSFILGGALGNLIDRIADGRVTDFIDWYAGNYHWPTFNVADSFITVGVALLIIEGIFVSKK